MVGWGWARRRLVMKRLCYQLLLVTLMGAAGVVAVPGVSSSAAPFNILPPNCETSYDGITYCIEDDGDIHIVIIDLDSPSIRFEMVMADDVTSVDTNHRERIEDMVQRSSYRDQKVVVAINADYFGRSHGPEGLTVKNGRRLDGGDQNQNPNALWRSSLAISRLNQVFLGRKSAEELDNARVFRERFYNAIGGGPLILNYGVVIPNAVACLLEQFPVGACRRRIQTAAGLSEDGRRLYLAAGKGRDIEGFARLLRDYGAFTAMKLDGGGSSQLWYDEEMRHDTDRQVGNALLVFYSPVPGHDAHLDSPAQFPVVEPGEQVEIDFKIENTGFLDWEPGIGYRFKSVQGWPVLGAAFQRLPRPVPAGESLLSSITVHAPYRPGVYEAEWQLVHRAEPIGPRLWFAVVVLPVEGARGGLRRQVETLLARQRRLPRFEQEWPVLRQEIERAIWREVEAELRAAHGGANGPIIVPATAVNRAWWMPLLQRLPW